MSTDNSSTFSKGLNLSEGLFSEFVEPAIRDSKVAYSAGLIGNGSEVLGFDNEISSDHNWGPRIMLFIDDEDFESKAALLTGILSEAIPQTYQGFATRFPGPTDLGVSTDNYGCVFYTIQNFFQNQIGFDVSNELQATDWLSFPQQKLATICGGKLFHDELNLESVRQRFKYYPHDVWLYILASVWNRIEQEGHLMGRAGMVGDEIGSSLIAARLVRDMMNLCFLMEQRYAPYPKWFGTAFAQLKSADKLEPIFKLVLSSSEWRERQRWITEAYKILSVMHNRLKITEPQKTQPFKFFDRPYFVISTGEISKAIVAAIQDPQVLRLLDKRLIGSIDQISDNTDILSSSNYRNIIQQLYEV